MKYLKLFLLASIIVGCDVFSTRTPEAPDNSGNSFIPPTEPSVVIQNFESSLRSKNLENYLKCFNSDNAIPQNKFLFFPSQEANSSFATLFVNWSNEEERRFFNSFKAVLGNESIPSLNWLERKPIIENPDSAVFESDYNLFANFSDNNMPKQYFGKVRFVLISDNNGLWSISKWYDYNLTKSDTILNSFSILKAKLYN